MSKRGKRGAWPIAVAGLGLLTAGAWFGSTPSLQKDLQQQGTKVLQAAGMGQAKVEVHGRDVVLHGQVSSEDARQQMVKKVLAIRGVRRVDAAGVEVKAAADREAVAPVAPQTGEKPAARPVEQAAEAKQVPPRAAAQKSEPAASPPAPPPAPTVNKLLANSAQPRITGTIKAPEKVKQLKVELAGRTYVEGDGHLRRDGSTWQLVPAEPLAEGVHDVVVVAIGEGGASSTDATRGEITIDVTPPAAPKVEELRLAGRQAIMRGSWPEGDAKLLRIVVGGEKYDIGAPDGALTREGDGRFRLMLPASRLPAMRSASLLVVDAAGNVMEARPPETIIGNTCQQQVDDVLIQDMIHFRTGSAEISDDSRLLLKRLAEVLRGCAGMEVVIVGHTDNVGDLRGNQRLSEERANAVKRALVEHGVPPDGIVARGEGETQPLVPNTSERNRQINRRIEISVRPRQ